MATEWARTEQGFMAFPTTGSGAEALVSSGGPNGVGLGPIALIKIPAVLLFVFGEWALDESLGFNWQAIWAQKSPLLAQLQAQIRKAILAIQINGATLVASVSDLAVAYASDTRAFQYALTATLVERDPGEPAVTTYGVTPTGFVIKPPSAIVASITAYLLANVAPDLDVAPDQPLGQLIGILANELSSGGWEIGQVAYNATNRGDAEGDLLDNIGGLTGTEREGESPSTVPCVAQFSQAGTYPAGSLAAYVAGVPAQQWTNAVAITVPATANGIAGISPVPPINPTAPGGAISATNPFTSVGVQWQSTVDGPTYGEALAAIETTSPNALNQVVPVSGWLNILDTGDITLGSLEELDPPYRLRQYQELSAPGSSTLDAIGANILEALATVPVVGATVEMYENTTLATDGNGQPAKSFQAVVYDLSPIGPQLNTNNMLIAAAIWNNKPAGMLDYGTTTVSYTDSIGVVRSVSFTRPTAIVVHLAVTVAVSASMTSGQRTALQQTIAASLEAATQGQPFPLFGVTYTPAYGAPTTLVPGQDVIASQLLAIIQGQTGVISATPTGSTLITSPTPATDGNLAVSIGQVGTVQAANVTVTVVTFVPGSP